MSGFDNEVLFANNYDFRGVVPVVAQVTAEGQLPIGTGASPAIEVGVLTSPDSSITIGYSNPDITIQAGDAVATTYQAQTGSATPSGNILNVYGIQETSTRASGNTVNVFSPRVARFVVDPTTDRGNYSTIQSAINAASSGETIFVRPGTYTENISGKAGVHLSSFTGDQTNPNVEIVGKVSLSSGTMVLSGLRLTTNGDYCLEASGSGGFRLISCFINGTDNSTINNSGTGAITLRLCQGNLETTGINVCTNSSSGNISFRYCNWSNTGSSTTASTASSGNIRIQQSEMATPFSTSSSGTITISNSSLDNSSINTTTLTTAGTGQSELSLCSINSGTASDVSIGSGTTVVVHNTRCDGTNANIITGAGTLKFSDVSGIVSSAMNPTSTTGQNFFVENLSFNQGADLLSDYDEGTWTPSIGGAGGNPTVTYNTQSGIYTRIGDVVHIKYIININTYSGGSGNAELDGLPFTSANDGVTVRNNLSTSGVAYPASVLSLSTSIGPNAASGLFTGDKDNAAAVALQTSDIAAGDVFIGEITYWV